jgi:hypothetical protein
MSSPLTATRPRRGRHARARAVRWLVALAAAVVVFGIGVAVGEALHDNPKPGISVTHVSTLHP